MEIREFKNGTFQVWRDNKVLRPEELTWENDYQSEHNFMRFSTMKSATKAVEDVLAKELIVNTYTVTIDKKTL
jgi:hypothetical protein